MSRRSPILTGGVVAYNEATRIRGALESLLAQELPPGGAWDRIWVVASGCTDGTASIARSIDPRIQVIEEPERRGKAAALLEIFRRAQGDYLVLLNADAVAAPTAIRELLATAEPLHAPFAVMAHPLPPQPPDPGFGESVDLLWELHHRFHEFVIGRGEGTHLSDELLLLPTDALPPLPPGVVNDGAFVGAWLTTQGGRLAYAPAAHVTIEVPLRFHDHVAQRRRIVFGHREVTDLVGVPPLTLERYARHHPRRAAGLLLGALRGRPHALRALSVLVAAEISAGVFAQWDRVPPRRDHTRWTTLPEPHGSPERTAR
jgi:glycosyltransferase involved in cell wall biosynthesis